MESISLSRLRAWVWSVPMYVKVVGIVLIVSVVLGGITYLELRRSVNYTWDQIRIETAYYAAHTVAFQLKDQELEIRSEVAYDAIDRVLEAFPDIRYVLIQDAEDHVMAHYFGFPVDLPPDVEVIQGEVCSACHQPVERYDVASTLIEELMEPGLSAQNFQRYSRPTGTILEATSPILDGGTVRVGLGEGTHSQAMASLTASLLRNFGICVAIGLGIALTMTYLLTRPIQNLVQATTAIRDGDFTARAEVHSSDEIGRLAREFNRMADELESFRDEVAEKEAARASLIERIIQIQEEERVSIARELHDSLGQSLLGVLLSLRSKQEDDATEDTRNADIEMEIQRLIKEVRQMAFQIRPSVLDDYGLDSALSNYVNDISDHSGVPMDYQCKNGPSSERLPREVEVTLYRVAQEAITNVIRHAEASQASIILLREGKNTTLVVEDDGKGFDTTKLNFRDSSCLGLMGMEERVSLIGGELVIESQPGKGAMIRIRVAVNGDT